MSPSDAFCECKGFCVTVGSFYSLSSRVGTLVFGLTSACRAMCFELNAFGSQVFDGATSRSIGYHFGECKC